MKRIILSSILVLILAYFSFPANAMDEVAKAWEHSLVPENVKASEVRAPVETDDEAPDFTLPDVDSNRVTLSELTEQEQVLLVFGNTHCPHCAELVPFLNEQEEDGLNVIFVAIGGTKNSVSGYIQEHDVGFTILLDTDRSVTRSYGIRTIPQGYLIDIDGQVMMGGAKDSGMLWAFLSGQELQPSAAAGEEDSGCETEEPTIIYTTETGQEIYIDSCQVLDQPDTKYILTRDLIGDDVFNTGNGCFSITASGVTLDCQGYQINNPNFGGPGVYSDQNGTTVKNCIISVGMNGFARGICLFSNQNNELTNNILKSSIAGIQLRASSNNILSGNTAYLNKYGLHVDGGLTNEMIGNTFCSNSIADVFCTSPQNFANNYCDSGTVCGGVCQPCQAIYIDTCQVLNQPDTKYVLTRDLVGDDVFNTGDGCFSITAPGVTLDCQGYQINNPNLGNRGVYSNQNGTTVKNCIITVGNSGGGWEYGIELKSNQNNELTENTVTGNIAGIYLKSSSNSILSGNTAYLNKYGLYVDDGSNNNITGNTFCSNTIQDVYCTSPQTFTNNRCGSGEVCGGVCESCLILYRSGAAITEFLEGKDDHSLADSDFPPQGCLLNGGLSNSCKPRYSFYLPDISPISYLHVQVYGKGTFDTDITIGDDFIGNGLESSESWNDFVYPDVASLPVIADAGDGIGSRLDIVIDATSHNYDIREMHVSYGYSSPELRFLDEFHEAYGGYRAISNFKTDIVDSTWGLSGTISDEIIKKAVQRTGAFCQNLLGLDGNIYSAVKSFFASLESFQNLVDLIYDYFDFITFWGNWPIEYPYNYPSLEKIKDDSDNAANACADLATAYQLLAFDGIDDSGEAEQILDAVNNAQTELQTLKNTLISTAGKMWDEYQYNDSEQARLSRQSMSPLMRYDPCSTTLYDSYLPNLIDAIQAQAEQFVTIDFSIIPDNKGLHYTVDGTDYYGDTSFVWFSGSAHDISAPWNKVGNDGYYWEFDGWSGGLNRQQTIYPTTDATYTVTYRVDASPPVPDPMTWEVEPYTISTTAITMLASEASDPEDNGVEYYFDETTGNPEGSDSGWQNERTYTDTGLAPNTSYSYSVKARDRSLNDALNVTAPSVPITVKTFQIGDFDGSYVIDIDDLMMLLGSWMLNSSDPEFCTVCDISKNNKIDLPDFAGLAEHWQEDNR